MNAPPEKRKAVLAGTASQKIGNRARNSSGDNSASIEDFQAKFICARWEHVSQPLGRVIAEHAFSTGGAHG